MDIGKDRVVSMHYTVATAEGEHVDKSAEGEPMVYLHGHGQIIPGLERALDGKANGATVQAEIAPKDAYGDYDQALDIRVAASSFPANVRKDLKPGFRFQAAHPTKKGEQIVFTVHRLEKDEVLVSGNHPLAGQSLLFKVEVVDVREASAEELAHGHAHGAGGHHHH